MRLILRIPPSINHMYVNARFKKRIAKVLSHAAKIWFEEAVIITNNWRQFSNWQTQDGKTVVNIWFYLPDNRRRDTHNSLKILMDALEDGRIYEDDRYAMPRIMDYEIDKDNPRIEIEFKVFTNDEKIIEKIATDIDVGT